MQCQSSLLILLLLMILIANFAIPFDHRIKIMEVKAREIPRPYQKAKKLLNNKVTVIQWSHWSNFKKT